MIGGGIGEFSVVEVVVVVVVVVVVGSVRTGDKEILSFCSGIGALSIVTVIEGGIEESALELKCFSFFFFFLSGPELSLSEEEEELEELESESLEESLEEELSGSLSISTLG